VVSCVYGEYRVALLLFWTTTSYPVNLILLLRAST
jgi:hypothetical protein